MRKFIFQNLRLLATLFGLASLLQTLTNKKDLFYLAFLDYLDQFDLDHIRLDRNKMQNFLFVRESESGSNLPLGKGRVLTGESR